MSDRFASHAAKLAGIAAALVGWPPETFWHATPEELAAVLDALNGERPDGAPPAPDTIAALREMHPDG